MNKVDVGPLCELAGRMELHQWSCWDYELKDFSRLQLNLNVSFKRCQTQTVRSMHLEDSSVYLKTEVLFLLCPHWTRNNFRIFKQTIIWFSRSLFIQYFFSSLARRSHSASQALFFFPFIFISWRLITLQYYSGFCHTLKWISHGFTCVPHPDPRSRLPPHPISLGLPSAPTLSTCLMHSTWAGDLFHPWQYTCFNAVLSEHPTFTFSQSPRVFSVHLCLSLCFAYRLIITIFLNSIYMH